MIRVLSVALSFVVPVSAVTFCTLAFTMPCYGEAIEVQPLLEKLHAVGPKGKGHADAITAWRALSQADADQLTEILAGMKDASKLTENWIRAVAEAVADRQLKSGRELPQAALERLVKDTKNPAKGRRVAYELVRRVDETAESRLIPPLLNDPSLELRRDAVALAVQAAKSLKGDAAGQAWRRALSGARDVDQIKEIAAAIRERKEEVDLPRHFGFIMRWQLIGPFDNRDKKGFDVAYSPEKDVALTEAHVGQDDKELKWFVTTTEDEFGNVDLNQVLGKFKGAICYAYAEFVSLDERDAEFRLGSINGNKVWVNGDLMTANHVYHSGTQIDQYVGRGRLKKGRNTILLKIAQNEQTENWAQRWQFQFRVCDQDGTAILSADRPGQQAAIAPLKLQIALD